MLSLCQAASATAKLSMDRARVTAAVHAGVVYDCGVLGWQTLNTGSLAWATAAAVAYFYMVSRPSKPAWNACRYPACDWDASP